MRIVQLITRPQRRGAEIFAVQLAEKLMRLGHEVWMISLLKGVGGLNYSGEFIQLDLAGNSRFDIKGTKKLLEVLHKIQPDVVQANAADTLRYAVGAKYFSKNPFKLVYRNANTISSFIKNSFQLGYNRALHAQVDAVASVSENSKKDYKKLFQPMVIQAISIGIEPKEIEFALTHNGLFSNQNYLVFLGSLVPEKNPLGMLDIFKEVLKIKPLLKLKIVGSGHLEKHLAEIIRSQNLQNSVELIPNQSNIFPILSNAKALVMPSTIEGLPAVILEAMYCKVPVIAYHVGGISEVLINEKTGWCIKAGDSDAFQETILKVLNSTPAEIARITTEAKGLILKKYQIDQIAMEFEMFYQSVITRE